MPKRKFRKRRQAGGFLNRYDFVCAGQDTINTGLNTFKRIVPGLIETNGNNIDNVPPKKSGWEGTQKGYSNFPEKS